MRTLCYTALAIPFLLLALLLAGIVITAHGNAGHAVSAPEADQATRLAPVMVTATVATDEALLARRAKLPYFAAQPQPPQPGHSLRMPYYSFEHGPQSNSED